MASLEFPGNNTTSVNQTRVNTTTSDSGSKEESKWRSDVKKLIEGAKNSITKSINTLGSKTEEVSDTIVTEVFGSGLLTRTLNDSMKGALKSVGTGIGKSASFIWEKISASKKDDKKDEKKRENKLITAILAPIRVLSKMFKFIQNSLTWIAEKGVSGLGKTLKYILIGAGIFIKWLKNWLMKSILFKALGKIGGLAWEGIKGVVSIGGELVGSIASTLVSTTAVSALTSGIKALFKGVSGKLFISSLLKFIGKGALYSALLAAIGWAGGNAVNSIGRVIDIKKAYNKIENGEYIGVPEKLPGESQRDYNERLLEDYRRKERVKSDIHEKAYEEWLINYPILARELKFDRPWWWQDKDDSGYKDYSEDRFNEFKTALRELRTGKGDWSPFVRLEYENRKNDLKNKAVLKNTAGVTST